MLLNTVKRIRIRNIRKFTTSTHDENVTNMPHTPVMANEVLQYLKPEKDHTILDMTFGAAGHSRKILESAPNVKLIALDRDPIAIKHAEELSQEYPNQVVAVLGRFSDLPKLLKENNIRQNSIDGILCDFGCSSMQFDSAERGFSLSKNGPLDMRMGCNEDSPTAAEILAKATEEDIYKILKYYGEEKQARKIARAIVDARYLFKNLTTTQELADLVESVCTDEFRVDKIQRKAHVATKTFQALRIFVNNELNEINYGMIVSQHYLKIGGRLVTLTFHSLEDTIVKRHLFGNLIANAANPLPLKYSSMASNVSFDFSVDEITSSWKSLTKHVLIPKFEEIEENPRSRSAKLRAAIRVK